METQTDERLTVHIFRWLHRGRSVRTELEMLGFEVLRDVSYDPRNSRTDVVLPDGWTYSTDPETLGVTIRDLDDRIRVSEDTLLQCVVIHYI